MVTISQNLEQSGPNFALHSGTTQDMCMKNIIKISGKFRVLGPEQRFDLHRQLQSHQSHIDPTLHVGPNNEHILLILNAKLEAAKSQLATKYQNDW